MNNSKVNIPCILVLSLMVSGCELIGPKLHEKLPIKLADEIAEVEQPEVIYQELSNEALQVVDESRVKVELYPGTGEFVSQKGVEISGKAKGRGEYSLNFDDADLGEVTKVVLSDILGANYVLSPKVTGKVTLQTTQPLSKAELLPTLEMLLQLNNAVLIHQNGIFQIKPKSEAMSGSAFTAYKNYKQKLPTGHQIRVVPVRYVAVSELAEIIKPLVQDKTILHVDINRNMMLITGSEAELDRAMEMVETFDVDVMKGRSFGLFPLQYVAAETIIQELEQVFNQKDKDFGAEFFQFMEIERLNAILAITHQPKYLHNIEQWVLRLDKANTSTGGGVNVYRAQHVDAIVMAETLNEIFSQGGQSRRPPSVAAGRKTVEVTNKQKKTETTKRRKTSSVASVGDVGEVSIIADEPNNALIIVATAQDYTVIHKVIKQLDVMPLQVLIDATIVDVQLTD
ncbi:MAG: type II secretion system protein GspD, partial [Methylococcales bacterium]|nr:type II secretion system protein GspD [Methylococcales bacterium]